VYFNIFNISVIHFLKHITTNYNTHTHTHTLLPYYYHIIILIYTHYCSVITGGDVGDILHYNQPSRTFFYYVNLFLVYTVYNIYHFGIKMNWDMSCKL